MINSEKKLLEKLVGGLGSMDIKGVSIDSRNIKEMERYAVGQSAWLLVLQLPWYS